MMPPEISEVQSPGDVTKILGLRLDDPFSPQRLRAAYRKAVARERYALKDVRLAYKIARDDYYRAAFLHYGSRHLIDEAGFFDDGLAPGILEQIFQKKICATPVNKIQTNINLNEGEARDDKPYIVLMANGAFAPVHPGHLAMMDAAYAALSKAGYIVVGGYISPDHDSYVRTKGDFAELWSTPIRLQALNTVLAMNSWLEVDSWASVHAPTDLNYTDILRHLKAYLAENVVSHRRLEVAHVFGSDHIHYARAFREQGMAICVSNRLTEKEKVSHARCEFSSLSDRIFFVETPYGDHSSRAIRIGKQPLLEALSNLPYFSQLISKPQP